MGYEIDFLAVGEGERSGDAIAFRYGNLLGPRSEQTVGIIDGGNRESGEKLVEHVKTFYKTDTVEFVFLTHPDADHASGLIPVLEDLNVGMLLMHQPWTWSQEIKSLFDDDRLTCTSISERTKEAFAAAHELERIAKEKNIKILEPFAGVGNSGPLLVLGPTQEFYCEQLSKFRCMPETKADNLLAILARAAEKIVKWITEGWSNETLTEPAEDATSAENQTSVILLLTVDGEKMLFTGDAGVAALNQAADLAERRGIDLKTVKFFQVPHHGSKRNVGPSILNRIVGPILATDYPTKTAFASAAKDGAPKHPSKKVLNAFRRRGVAVHATQGAGKCQYNGAPLRPGWSASTAEQFHSQVEE